MTFHGNKRTCISHHNMLLNMIKLLNVSSFSLVRNLFTNLPATEKSFNRGAENVFRRSGNIIQLRSFLSCQQQFHFLPNCLPWNANRHVGNIGLFNWLRNMAAKSLLGTESHSTSSSTTLAQNRDLLYHVTGSYRFWWNLWSVYSQCLDWILKNAFLLGNPVLPTKKVRRYMKRRNKAARNFLLNTPFGRLVTKFLGELTVVFSELAFCVANHKLELNHPCVHHWQFKLFRFVQPVLYWHLRNTVDVKFQVVLL